MIKKEVLSNRSFWKGNAVLVILLVGFAHYALTINVFNSYEGIIAFLLLAFCTITTLHNPSFGVRATFFALLIGVLSFAQFFVITWSFSVSIVLTITIEVICLALLIVHFNLNKTVLGPFLKKTVYREVSNEELIEDQRVVIDGYKRRFKKKNKADLIVTSQNERLVPEARLAAKEILEEEGLNEA